ncbi:LpxL/LpxP family Kdo(2)-lipid IV(A) lauroyl/palmitoleoyl acyltransferase [Teredinibacter purpureus]|uniref:LpxL/LpxP family Kdo(2)-lipid IV(A) lauroyl/palmitoleoyl acyltransferase n=1 Tax=Teredinibacter purpureus TaxID=2731756 RepID=UPI0005F88268|nr:LpxL/LpxP family Kdo(2)-lipid IV(A) lauroyl/palmitoleoyl acyltransferase [Teredinibacter purpureus]
MSLIKFENKLLHPRYLMTWLLMLLWWLLVQLLPMTVQRFLGRRLGDLLYILPISRKRIAKINLEKCYPDLTVREVNALVRSTLRATGIGVFESGAAWFWPAWRIKKAFTISGLEYLDAAQESGSGVLFMGIHFTAIEFGAACVNTVTSIDGFYRPHKNAVYEYVQAWGRIRRNNNSRVIPNGDVRKIVRALREGRAVNYAPDQDYGRQRSVFVPFFGINTATVKAPAQLAKAGRAEVIPWVTTRKPNGRYHISLYPSITSNLSGNEQENAVTINQFVEARVRENPDQYLWVHRRFKTRPEGEVSFY